MENYVHIPKYHYKEFYTYNFYKFRYRLKRPKNKIMALIVVFIVKLFSPHYTEGMVTYYSKDYKKGWKKGGDFYIGKVVTNTIVAGEDIDKGDLAYFDMAERVARKVK